MTNMPEAEQKPVAAPIEAEKVNVTKKVFLMGFFGFLGAIIILGLGFDIYRVYAKGASDNFSMGLASALRLPIAKVNGDTILFKDYFEDLRAIKAMRDYDKKAGGPAASLTDANLSDQVLFRQVNNILIKSLANKMGVTVEQKDIDAVKTDILVKQFGDLTKAATAIKDRYGWTLKEFEDKVINQYILQNKLAAKVSENAADRAALQAKAQGVLDQIKKSADFAAMAAEYGSDGTAQKGGDLGWFGKGDMVPQFETAAFALKKGELATNLVETQYGYHIVQVTDKRTTKVKDPTTGKMVIKDEVSARHILFAFPTLDKVLSDELKKATIKVYGSVNNPFAVLNQASSTTP